MNYYEYFLNSKGNRDSVFEDVFSKVKCQTILEIGVARDLNLSSRRGDGWSSLYFGHQLIQNKGTLISIDIDINSLNNCEQLCKDLDRGINHIYILGDGVKAIPSEFLFKIDFAYLDGSDSPMEMLGQFEFLNQKIANLPILCDDFHTKGNVLKQKYLNYLLYTWVGNPHQLAIYNTKETGIKQFNIIE